MRVFRARVLLDSTDTPKTAAVWLPGPQFHARIPLGYSVKAVLYGLNTKTTNSSGHKSAFSHTRKKPRRARSLPGMGARKQAWAHPSAAESQESPKHCLDGWNGMDLLTDGDASINND